MTRIWIVVLVVGAATVVFKAAGPVFVGGRQLPARVQSIVALLAPVMLTALVVTQTFGGDEEIVIDARLPGVAAAGVAIWRGAPVVSGDGDRRFGDRTPSLRVISAGVGPEARHVRGRPQLLPLARAG
jgi:branched-subunit amino acid transport protein